MATKNDIANLVNNMILWTRNNELNWNSTNVGDLNISIPSDFELEGLIYTSILNKEHLRIYKLVPKQPLFPNYTTSIFNHNNKIVYKLQIFKQYSSTVLFEFPSLSQLADLYKAASKQIFDIEEFFSQLNDMGSTKNK